MKKQLILAVISAALVVTPFVDAATSSTSRSSGFSKSSSSSSSKPSSSGSSYKSSSASSSSSYKPSSSSYSAPKRDYSPSSTSASTPRRDYAPSPAPTRVDTRSSSTSGMSGFGLSGRKAEQRAADNTQPSRVAPQPSTPYGSAPTAASAIAQPKTGFATNTTSSTKKKLAGAAGATALGGALYVAGSNQDAVAAYEASQQPTPKPAPPTPSAPSTAAAAVSTPKYDTRTASVPAPQHAPQVIVIKERSYPRNDPYYDADDAYRDGVRDAQRNARIATQSSRSYEPGLQLPHAQVNQQSASAKAPAAGKDSHFVSSIIWAVVFLVALLAFAFLMKRLSEIREAKSRAKPAARGSNYTL